MPSPFPGMDPFLEHADLFPDLHDAFIIFLKEQLQSRLPEPYFAQSGERVWVEMSERFVRPDINVRRAGEAGGAAGMSGAGVALAMPPRIRPVLVSVPLDQGREVFLEVRTREGEANRLVTAIEVLSPTNKKPGDTRREEYLRKQKELLHGTAHLVEIDLLRGGEHSTAVPEAWARQKAGPFDYHVCIHRFDRLADFLVYPIQLTEPLPEIEIPLLPGDGGVTADLQAVFHRCYDAGPYRRRVRYLEDLPVPPLAPPLRDWAAGVLAAAPRAGGHPS